MMYARSTSLTGDAGQIDTLVEYVRDEVMPAVTAMRTDCSDFAGPL